MFVLLAAATVVVGLVATVVIAVRKRNVLRAAGLDPSTADAQLLAQAHTSRALAPERSAETRLAEALDLHRAACVTADELGEIRQRILGEV